MCLCLSVHINPIGLAGHSLKRNHRSGDWAAKPDLLGHSSQCAFWGNADELVLAEDSLRIHTQELCSCGKWNCPHATTLEDPRNSSVASQEPGLEEAGLPRGPCDADSLRRVLVWFVWGCEATAWIIMALRSVPTRDCFLKQALNAGGTGF